MEKIPQIPAGFDSKEIKKYTSGKEEIKDLSQFRVENKKLINELENMIPLYNDKLRALEEFRRILYKESISEKDQEKISDIKKKFDSLNKETYEVSVLLNRMEKYLYDIINENREHLN